MKLNRFVFVATCFCVIILSTSAESESGNNSYINDSESTHETIYIAAANEYGGPKEEPQKIFDCQEKIYTTVLLENYEKGKHHLSVEWKDPHNAVREHTQYYFYTHNSKARVWASLSLSRGKGASLLKFVNPSAGLNEFIGLWQARVKIDNKPIGVNKFEVSC